jgi:metal-responsive CopG/Arc/MetJ family transcriptional regulator
MPPKTKGRQVNIFIPEGLYEEIIRVMEKANTWMNVQDFVRDAIIEKIEKYDKEHAV